MAYTAPDARTFAKERKSLAEKITAELARIDSELDTLVLGGLTLASGEIYVGDAGGSATAVTPSGDVTISNTGVTTIGAKKVTAAMTALADGKIMIGGATGVAAEKTISGDITMTNEGVVSLAAGAIDPAVLTLADGYIIVGDAGGGGAAVAMTGDVAIANTGATTIQAKAVEPSMIALTEAHVLVGNGGAASDVALSGDITVDKTGAVTIGAKKVTESMVALADGKILIGGAGGAAAAQTPTGILAMTNAGVTSIPLTEAYILVGDGGTPSKAAGVAMSGDVTISKTGATTIGAKKVTPSMVALTEAHILVGDGGAGADVAISGDVTIDKTGAVTIASSAVEAGMIANGILTGDKVANTGSDNAIGGIPMIYEIAIEHASADNDIIITHKSKVLDFWFIPSGVPSVNDKVQLFNGVNAITDNIACVATESAVVRATTIDDTYSTINASGTMRVTAVADTAVAGKAYVMAIRVA